MNYLLSILIIVLLASQTMIWHSLATIRDAIHQTNAITLAACGTDERPCQVAAQRGPDRAWRDQNTHARRRWVLVRA
jgi:hypothetical protein